MMNNLYFAQMGLLTLCMRKSLRDKNNKTLEANTEEQRI